MVRMNIPVLRLAIRFQDLTRTYQVKAWVLVE